MDPMTMMIWVIESTYLWQDAFVLSNHFSFSRTCLAQLNTTFSTKGHARISLLIYSKKWWSKPKIHGFRGISQGVLHNSEFHGVGENYPPLPLVSEKWSVRFFFFRPSWGPGASQWSMDDRSSVMSDWQRVLDWLLA
jgi:hypothetical protein